MLYVCLEFRVSLIGLRHQNWLDATNVVLTASLSIAWAQLDCSDSGRASIEFTHSFGSLSSSQHKLITGTHPAALVLLDVPTAYAYAQPSGVRDLRLTLSTWPNFTSNWLGWVASMVLCTSNHAWCSSSTWSSTTEGNQPALDASIGSSAYIHPNSVWEWGHTRTKSSTSADSRPAPSPFTRLHTRRIGFWDASSGLSTKIQSWKSWVDMSGLDGYVICLYNNTYVYIYIDIDIDTHIYKYIYIYM